METQKAVCLVEKKAGQRAEMMVVMMVDLRVEKKAGYWEQHSLTVTQKAVCLVEKMAVIFAKFIQAKRLIEQMNIELK